MLAFAFKNRHRTQQVQFFSLSTMDTLEHINLVVDDEVLSWDPDFSVFWDH